MPILIQYVRDSEEQRRRKKDCAVELPIDIVNNSKPLLIVFNLELEAKLSRKRSDV